MKTHQHMFLTEEQVRELMDGYGETKTEVTKKVEKRNQHIIKHYQLNMLALSGVHE